MVVVGLEAPRQETAEDFAGRGRQALCSDGTSGSRGKGTGPVSISL